MDTDLPYIDEHGITVQAPREQVWAGLQAYVDRSLRRAAASPLAWVLGTEPRAGFEVAETVPTQRLALAGRHRFARYLLVFDLADTDEGSTRLRARSYGAFPGPHGRAYRALVIGTRVHVFAVNRLLRSIRSRADQ